MAIKIINGVNESTLNIDGYSIEDVIGQYQEILGISDDQTVKVNGAEVGADYVLENGDTIEFVKEAGVKGSDCVSVRVQSGVNVVDIQVEDGTPVREVLEQASVLLGFSLGDGSTVTLNGSATSEETPVSAGDRIEFRKEAGRKG